VPGHDRILTGNLASHPEDFKQKSASDYAQNVLGTQPISYKGLSIEELNELRQKLRTIRDDHDAKCIPRTL
jgi:hypothetical protein